VALAQKPYRHVIRSRGLQNASCGRRTVLGATESSF